MNRMPLPSRDPVKSPCGVNVAAMLRGCLVGCVAFAMGLGACTSGSDSESASTIESGFRSKCGNGTCEPKRGETCSTCPQDCGPCPASCGDGTCNGTETCSTCPKDCGTCPPACGDGTCNGTETCSTCPKDCGTCPPACGDGTCNGTETCSTCPQDCGACSSSCGDGTCNGTETCSTCPADCGACPNGDPTSGVLPSYNDAWANWNHAGVPGGIPNRTTVCATVNPLGGGKDDYNNIQNAIDNCPAGQVVQLGAGAFSIQIADLAITIPSGITLRGSGTCNKASSPYCPTSITVTDGVLPYNQVGNSPQCGSASAPVDCPNGGPPIIAMGLVQPQAGSVGWLSGVVLDADAKQGATTVQLHDTTAFSAGQYVLIDEDPAAGWVNDPMGTNTNFGQVWATSDWLSPSGGPATGRMVWPGANGSNSWDMGTTDPRTPGSEGCWFTNNCGRATAEIHKIVSIGSGPCPGTNCTMTFDDPLIVGFRQSGGHNAKVYPPGVTMCNGCQWQPGQNMLENAGVENLSLARGFAGSLGMNFCAGCWVKNVEIADWVGGIEVSNSIRSEFNTILDQYSWNSCNNGAEYAIDFKASSTEMLVTNSIIQYAGKSMTARAGGAGSVISYNVFDKTMYSDPPGCIPDTWVETEMPSGHYPGAHHILMEGNFTNNIDNDNTHGSNAYHTAFRNESTGARSKFTDPSTGTVVDDINDLPGGNGPLRAVGPMSYNYWMAYVGNVLGISGKTTSGNGWVYDSTCGWCSSSIFMLGWNTGNGGADPYLDGIKGSYLFRHGNYDYYNSATLWDANYANHTLPNSFYLSAKPAFFSGSSCTYAWPWVTPTSPTQIQSNSCGGSGLPAKARADAGTPFVTP